MLEYRGYYGSIERSQEDHCLFGKLLFISALVSYEGKTLTQLSEAFRDAVDDYLEICKALGRAPSPARGRGREGVKTA